MTEEPVPCQIIHFIAPIPRSGSMPVVASHHYMCVGRGEGALRLMKSQQDLRNYGNKEAFEVHGSWTSQATKGRTQG